MRIRIYDTWKMEPFYFGTPAEPLFGVYHPPTSGRPRDEGVVLCHPIGYEYINSHRAFHELAVRLSEVGYCVLRFDYYACGDSSGNCEEGQIKRWLVDISTAIDELRFRCGAINLCVVGFRLGATLSALVGGPRSDIEHMVLWDPIINGKSHIKELTRRHQAMLRRANIRPPRNSGAMKELLGFPLTETLLHEIETIDLLAVQENPASQILLIQTHATDHNGQLREQLVRLGSRVEYRHLPDHNTGAWIENISNVLVPNPILNSIVSWIRKVCQ